MIAFAEAGILESAERHEVSRVGQEVTSVTVGAPAPRCQMSRTSTLFALLTPVLAASAALQTQEPIARVTVDLVQVEVVVTDSKGNRVTDLTADEMEIFENGQPRRITHFSFIPEVTSGTQTSAVTADRGRILKAADVRRVMAVVVDDLGMDHQSFATMRPALESFLAQEFLPGDLVALILTSGRFGGLARLTNDRRLLRATLECFNSLPIHRTGVRERTCGSGPIKAAMFADDANRVAEAHHSHLTLAALRRIVDGLRGLPGRKSILLFSEGMPLIRNSGLGDIDQVLMDRYNALLAHADRSGVSVNTIDPRGLTPGAFTAEDVSAAEDFCIKERRTELIYTQQQLADIARRTAGISISDENDLPAAIGRIIREQSWYLPGGLAAR
jgi:VWFA-related protein